MPETRAFWIDAEYDRECSDDGVSRYASCVRQWAFEPWTDNDQAVELAEFAWRRATGPVMVPGYVRRHGRILSAHLARSDWDGSLIAAVDILTSKPGGLSGPRSADPEAGPWRDWPSEFQFASDREVFREPDSDELARGSRFMLASVSLRFTVPSAGLPVPRPGGADFETCRLAIGVLVHELNVIVGPVLRRIEGG